MLFGRKKAGFIEKAEVQGGAITEGASASIDKNGVIRVDSAELEEVSKRDLLDYLEEQPDAEDPFAGIPVPVKEEPKELTKAQQLAEYIRRRSAGACLTSYSALKAEDSEIDALLEELETEESCADIAQIKGNKDVYYYANSNMSDNYAMIAMYVEEKDLVVTISQLVRFNCKTYPAPTPLEYFEKHPYFYTKPQIERTIMLMEEREDCRDIKRITNKEGKQFLFSDACMTPVYARALCEPEEYAD